MRLQSRCDDVIVVDRRIGQEAAGSPQDCLPEVSTDPDDLFIASNRYPYQGWSTFRAKCASESNEAQLRRVFYEGQDAGFHEDLYLKMARLGLSEQDGDSPIRAGVQIYDEGAQCLSWYSSMP